jgi:putative membrane protein
MTHHTTNFEGTARRITMVAVTLLVAATGPAAAHGSGGGGMMGGGGWGLLGGTMGLWGLLWMGVLIAVPLLIGYALLTRESGGTEEQALAVLREQYARGELTDEEFDRRRDQLDRTG